METKIWKTESELIPGDLLISSKNPHFDLRIRSYDHLIVEIKIKKIIE